MLDLAGDYPVQLTIQKHWLMEPVSVEGVRGNINLCAVIITVAMMKFRQRVGS